MVLVEIKGICVFVVSLAVVAFEGALTAFFVYLSSHKRDFWELIYERSNKNFEREHCSDRSKKGKLLIKNEYLTERIRL